MRPIFTYFGRLLRRILRRRARRFDRLVSRPTLDRLLEMMVGRLQVMPVGDVGRIADPVRDDMQRELIRQFRLTTGPQIMEQPWPRFDPRDSQCFTLGGLLALPIRNVSDDSSSFHQAFLTHVSG